MAKIKVSHMYLPRPASKYPGCYPLHFERRLPEILETDNFVHFFAGMSKSGYRIDVNPALGPDLVADVQKDTGLPACSFPGGMADPPYTEDFAKRLYNTPYPKWSLWTRELVRLVEPGGRIGVMHNYPVPQMKGCQLEELILIVLRIKQYIKVVTVQRKL